MESFDDLLKKEMKKIEARNAELAIQQIKLIEHSKNLEAEIQILEDKRDKIYLRIKEINEQEKLRENEREKELNRLGREIDRKKEFLDKKEELILEDEKLLKKKQEDLDESICKMDNSRCKSEKLNRDLKIILRGCEDKKDELSDLCEMQRRNTSSNLDLRNKLQDQINHHIGKAKRLDFIIKENENVVEEYSNREKDIQARIKTLNEKISETQIGLDKTKENNLILIKKISEAKEQRDIFEKRFYDLSDQAKKIELGWLRLNKKSRDLRAEEEIERLKNE